MRRVDENEITTDRDSVSRPLFLLLYPDVNFNHLHIMRYQRETASIMHIAGEDECIEAVFVEMDPVQGGFCGVLIELVAVGEGYAVVETAAGTGNRLLRFCSKRQALARSLFESELQLYQHVALGSSAAAARLSGIRRVE